MMTSLTPWVKRLMISWVALWVISYLFYLADVDLGTQLGLSPRALSEGDFFSVIGLVSYAFLHSTHGIWHLAFNCLVFYWTGPEIERYFPGRKFLRFVGVAIAVGALTHLGLYWTVGSQFGAPAIGGSGIVMACFAGLAALQPGIRVNLIFITVPILPLFLVFTGLDVLNLLAIIVGKGTGVASDIHIAGAAVGWYWGGGFHRFPIFARLSAKRQQAKQQKQTELRQNDEQELDRILAKISREGIGKLTATEKKFLEKRSRRPD
jgi:membrane associated rhomboid family serine protease